MSACASASAHELTATLAADDRPGDRSTPPTTSPKGHAPSDTPQKIGRHLILGRLGEGGMGVVYAAYDPELDRRLAIKVIPIRPRRAAGEDRETARARVLREAQAMARVSHPNVVAVFDVGVLDEQVYIAMELVEGESLGAWLERARRPWRSIVELLIAAGEGLAAAHDAGLIHRDFKPDNVLVDPRGRVRVADFGLARASAGPALAGDDEARPLSELETSGSALLRSDLTRAGALLGTPAYMSPEHFEGRALDARSDLFSFSVALFEAVYGERPFAGDTLATLCRAVLAGELREPARRREAPLWLWRTICAGLERDPERRPPSMPALLARLRRGLGARRRNLQRAGALAAGVGAAALWLAAGDPGPRCVGAADEIAAVWNPAREAALRGAFAAAELPYAEAAGRRAALALTEYAAAWAEMRDDVCAGAHLRGDLSDELQGLRTRCLDESRTILEERVELLTRPDARVIESADLLVAGLRPLRECADDDALRAELPPPADPLERAEVDALRRRLAAIHAAESAGHVEEGLAAIDPVIADAEALGYRPLVAEARRRRAALLRASSRHADALEEGERAYQEAERAGADALRAALAADLVYVAGRADHREAARVWSGIAEALLGRRPDPALAAELLRNQAAMAFFAGDLQTARTRAEAAVDAFTALRGPDDLEVLRALSNLGAIVLTTGESEAASAILREALARAEGTLGGHHPQLANILQNLATTELDLHHHAEALALYRRERSIRTPLVGEDHPNLVSLACNIASALKALGRLDEASAELTTCATLAARHFGPRSRETAHAETLRCDLLAAQGSLDEALTSCRAALELRRAIFGPEHVETLVPERMTGELLARRGACAEALPLRDQALAGAAAAALPRTPEAEAARERCVAAPPKRGRGR
ncbi:MAG: serine/threonine protein kinase [Myxococcales bacterium]|nr:serine/threonine protein kinase [Myxococcales bacterium]